MSLNVVIKLFFKKKPNFLSLAKVYAFNYDTHFFYEEIIVAIAGLDRENLGEHMGKVYSFTSVGYSDRVLNLRHYAAWLDKHPISQDSVFTIVPGKSLFYFI